MQKYLETYFESDLTEEDCKTILTDYPIPQCQALKLDPEVKDQLEEVRNSRGEI